LEAPQIGSFSSVLGGTDLEQNDPNAPTVPVEVVDRISRIPLFQGRRDVEVAPLQGGQSLNNTNWEVTTADGTRFVLRVGAGAGVSHLAVRRSEELSAARAAASAGIAPEILYADEEAGCLLTPLIAGRHWERDEFREPANMVRVADILRRLHAITQTPGDDGAVFRRIERLLENAAALGAELPSDIDRYRRRSNDIEAERAARRQSVPGLNHNDFWANNFLDDGERLWLLDWEFSGRGDGLYDLATLSLAGGYTAEEDARMLTAYGRDLSEDRTALPDMKWMVLFFEAAWSLAMHGLHGSNPAAKSGYDYLGHSRHMFGRMS
jgi:thiamine kinase-like enzyme